VVFRSVYRLNRSGFTAVELLVVIAIVGVMVLVSLPTLIGYMRAATAKAAAEELAAGINRGRQLAISQNQLVCVQILGNQYRYLLGGCAGPIWLGPGSGAGGFFTLANNITLATNTNPVFSNLGAAPTAANLTVTTNYPSGNITRTVVVAASGRVQIQ
jgi:prepilin-type N-terminal cleavage/methylation domain-containing protein